MSKVRYHICDGEAGSIGQEISGKMHFLWRLASPYHIGKSTPLIKIEYLQDPTAKLLRVQDLQDIMTKQKFRIQDLQDPTMKQKFRIQDSQHPKSPGSQDFKDARSAGSHNKLNVQLNVQQDPPTKCEEAWTIGSDSNNYKMQGANFMKIVPFPEI